MEGVGVHNVRTVHSVVLNHVNRVRQVIDCIGSRLRALDTQPEVQCRNHDCHFVRRQLLEKVDARMFRIQVCLLLIDKTRVKDKTYI